MVAVLDLTPEALELDKEAMTLLACGDTSPLNASARPGMNALVETIEHPALRLALTQLAPLPIVTYPGWIRGELAVLTAPGVDLPFQLLSLAADGAAARLAAMVGLAPRPCRAAPEIISVAFAGLAQLLVGPPRSGEEARLLLDLPAEAPDDLAIALGELPGSLRGRWSLSVEEAGETRLFLDVVDGGGSGYWQVMPTFEPERRLVASSASKLVWAQLTELCRIA